MTKLKEIIKLTGSLIQLWWWGFRTIIQTDRKEGGLFICITSTSIEGTDAVVLGRLYSQRADALKQEFKEKYGEVPQ